LLKELRHSVKQKNPYKEKRIKIPARNKSRPETRAKRAPRSPAWPSAAAHSRNKPGFDQKPNNESAEDEEEELIKPLSEICG
jgi:hypothetical protein